MDKRINKDLRTAILFFLLACTSLVCAQGVRANGEYAGTHFQFPTFFQKNVLNLGSIPFIMKPFVYISSATENCIHLYINDSLIDQLYTTKDSVFRYELPISSDTMLNCSGDYSTSYVVKSSYPINIVYHYPSLKYTNGFLSLGKGLSSAAFLLSAVQPQSKEYLIVDAPINQGGYSICSLSQSFFSLTDQSILQIKSPTGLGFINNQITFIPKSTLWSISIPEYEYISILDSTIRGFLNFRGQNGTLLKAQNLSFGFTYLLNGFDVYDHTRIVSYLPTCTREEVLFPPNIDDPFSSLNLVDDVAIPVVELDALQDYYFFQAFPMQRVNILRFVSVKDSTVVRFDGQIMAVLDSAQFKDTCTSSPAALIQANHPFALSQVGTTFMVLDSLNPAPVPSGVLADTGMDTTQCIQQSLFSTHIWEYATHFGVNLFTRTADTSAILLDGLPLQGNWTPFALNPRWSYGRFHFAPGVHKISGGKGFMAFHFGYVDNSYPYPDTIGIECYGHRLFGPGKAVVDSSLFSLDYYRTGPQFFSEFNDSICIGDSIAFRAPRAHYAHWVWSLDQQPIFSQSTGDSAAPRFYLHFEQAGAFWVKGYDSLACAPADSVLIYVQSPPTSQIQYAWEMGCGRSILKLESQSTSNQSAWLLPNGEWRSGNTIEILNPDWNFPQRIYYQSGEEGCRDTLSIQVETPLENNFMPQELPNVITPNGDFLNEAFVFEGMESFEGCYHLRVFNRWGALVFESEEVQSPFQGIDPSGGSLASGVYFYQLKLGETEYHGELHLFR